MVDNTEVFDREIETKISKGGFRPKLYLAADGSYKSNAVYGSGAAQLAAYATSDTSVSRAEVRKEDRSTRFSIFYRLNTTGAAPGVPDTAELRIGVQDLVSGEPARYATGLTGNRVGQRLPVFDQVEILLPNGQPLVLTTNAGLGVLKARLLVSGDLALIIDDPQTAGTAGIDALTALDLAGAFGGQSPYIDIIVSGEYISQEY